MTEGNQGFTPWPERFLTSGLVLGGVAMFTPWWGYTYPYPGWNGVGEVARMESTQINGFGNWGILYLLSLLLVGALLLMRSRWGGRLSQLALPISDWFIYGWSAVVMGISAVAVWDSLLLNSGFFRHVGIRYGWCVALAGAAVLFAGALLLRHETAPVGELEAKPGLEPG